MKRQVLQRGLLWGRKISLRSASDLAVKEESAAEDVVDCKSENSQDTRKQLYAWGLAEHGALGLENTSNRNHTKRPRFKHKPTRHFFAEENCVTYMDCGYGFTAFAVKNYTNDLKLFGCGLNTDGQLGYQAPREDRPLGMLISPAPINMCLKDPCTDVVALSAGRAHLAVVTDREGAFTMGSNCYGQCGRPIIPDEKYAASCYIHNIPCLDGARVVSVTCGQDHTSFLTEDGKVYTCGWSADGQTGLGTDENISCPTRVCGDISLECIVKVVGKCDSVMALSDKGEVFAWGNTEYGQFTSEANARTIINCPVYLEKLKCAGKIVDIAAGGSFCAALNEDGDVFVWGYGILGAGPRVNRTLDPVALPRTLFGCNEFLPDARVVSISCGLSHLAVTTNYCHLYTWGRNKEGCLGIGHIRDQYFPYKVCIGASVVQVSCGVDHTMALCKPFV